MRSASALLLAIASVAAVAGPLASQSIARNATAEVLVEKAVVLGIDFAPAGDDVPRAVEEDVQAHSNAGAGAWLHSQLEVPDDSIAAPPEALTRYLTQRREVLGVIVAALEVEPPEWRRSEPSTEGTLPFPEVLPSIRLQKVLLAAALVEIREGREQEAERLLEASWSLQRPAADSPMMIFQIGSIAAARWQAGVLRKMTEPPLAWMDRLARGEIWRGMLEGIAGEASWFEKNAAAMSLGDPFVELSRKAPGATATALKKLSPCEAARLDDAGAFGLVEREMMLSSASGGAEIREFYRDMWTPNVLSAVRRAARTALDQELTLTVMQVRLEKRGDSAGKWPPKLNNPVSVVCPDATYEYRASGSEMEIRLEAEMPSPDSHFVLPFSYRSAKADGVPPQPTQRPAPALTPTPEGGMMPRQ